VVDSAVLPLVTALLAGAMAARVAGGAARRYTPAKPLWALGLLLFAAASAAGAYGVADGWGEASFKVYYLAGACLCVAALGAGSAFVALPRGLALVILGAAGVAGIAATVTVVSAPVELEAIRTTTGLAAPPNDALGGSGSLWAIAMNSIGTLLLILGAALSIARRRAPVANVAILIGVVVIGLAGTTTRIGDPEWFFATQLLGLVILGVGVELAGRRTVSADRVDLAAS
jgi:hypothetical protein